MTKGRVAGKLETYGLPLYTYPVFVILVVLFSVCTEYDPAFGADTVKEIAGDNWERVPVGTSFSQGIMAYPMYMDAAAMCVMGFGFLYVFGRYYSLGGVGFNFFICGFCFLWVHVVKSFVASMFEEGFVKTQINMDSMVAACYVTASVLISFGAIYGFISPSQLLLLCIVEPFIMSINEHIVLEIMHVKDAGGSIVVHAFGAFFGIAVSIGMGIRPRRLEEDVQDAGYISNLAAMIGTIVLWMFWPSFNGALFYDDVTIQGRVVMNTYLAICASCVTAFATSTLSHRGRMEMLEIQNATLAGGVIIGMISSFSIEPWTAVLIGGIGGIISTCGYAFYAELLGKLGIADSADVQMLHGIPGVLGTIFAAFACLDKDQLNYAYSYDSQWTTTAGIDRSRNEQFGFVIASVLCTLAFALVGGLLTGAVMKLPCCPSVRYKDMLLDHDFWIISDKDHDPRKRRYKSENNNHNEVVTNINANM